MLVLVLLAPLSTLIAVALWATRGWVDALAFYVAALLGIGLFVLRLADHSPGVPVAVPVPEHESEEAADLKLG